jgi:hypothetical protein
MPQQEFVPVAQYVQPLQGPVPLLQDIQLLPVPLLVLALVLLYSDHRSDESLP